MNADVLSVAQLGWLMIPEERAVVIWRARITRRHSQGAVLISLATYNSLMETVHLLRSPANAAHLQRSLEQAERGEWLEHALIEPGQAGLRDPFAGIG
jgi:hypothetical protein